MTRIRRSLLFTSAERYTNLFINFILIASISRLLTPAEIGISVIGTTILGIIEVLRDVPTPYIIQEKELGRDDVATAFTCMLAFSLLFGVALIAGAGLIGRWYGDPKLVPYCQLLAIGLLPGPIERPIMACMRRNMAFGHLAVINVSGTFINAIVAVGTALAGFSFMSFAWAALAGNLATAAVALYLQRDISIFRLALTRWRHALAVGGYSSAWALTSRAPELVSYLLLGRLLRMDAVGLYNRARIVNDLPGKVLLSGLAPVVFPALALETRAGRNLAQPYLLALSIVSALHWPAFMILALLARPIVEVLLGPQWIDIVPLVQIIALANLLSFSKPLTQPALMAVGAFRDLLLSALIALPVGLVLITTGASLGLQALAWMLVLKVPIDASIELIFIRRHATFTWSAFAAAIRKSAIVAICAAAGPAVLVTLRGGESAVLCLALAAALAAAGWIGGLYLTKHPLAREITLAAAALSRARPGALRIAVPRRNAAGGDF